MRQKSMVIKVFVFAVWLVVVSCKLPAATTVIVENGVTPTSQVIEVINTSEPVTSTPVMIKMPVPTTIPTLGIGSIQVSTKDGMFMVYIPAGDFLMGSESGGEDEKPQHTVRLGAYYIDKTEVTNGMYTRCVEDGSCTPPGSPTSSTHSNYYGNKQFDNYPVIYVSWNQASAYCEWAGERLPSEAEWEKAARGTDGRTYPWGEGINCNLVNYAGELGKEFCVGDTTQVGSYPDGASPYGVLDIAGNVREMTADLYDVYPGGDPNASVEFGKTFRVVRGGSWDLYDNGTRSAYRGWIPADYWNNVNIGFRCVLSP